MITQFATANIGVATRADSTVYCYLVLQDQDLLLMLHSTAQVWCSTSATTVSWPFRSIISMRSGSWSFSSVVAHETAGLVFQDGYLWSVLRTNDATHYLASNCFSPTSLAAPAMTHENNVLAAELMTRSKDSLNRIAADLGLPKLRLSFPVLPPLPPQILLKLSVKWLVQAFPPLQSITPTTGRISMATIM